MEKLNEYLQSLLSTCSYELHLEPNKTPYLVSSNGNTDVANTPILGTQISMLIFPLIPAETKQDLPNKPEVEFVHNHKLGNFNFNVKKTPAGFNVTIRPVLAEGNASAGNVSAETAPAAPSVRMPVNNFQKPLSASAIEVEVIDTEADVQSNSMPAAPKMVSNFENEIKGAPTATVEAPQPAESIANKLEDLIQNASQKFAKPATPKTEKPSSAVTAKINLRATGRMDKLFYQMADVGASDLHLSVSMPPMIRKDGKMRVMECDEQKLTPDAMKELLTSIMPDRNLEEFAERHDTDFAYQIADLARFRANIFMDRKGMGGVFRIIPSKILTAEDLGLSKHILDLCNLSKGLVVVTGPTGSGKSTTLCAMVDHINRNREEHLITIEDPIEFTHENKKCLVNQREVHNHTDSFKDALRAALREDPDIVLVGEMRDLETIAIAIETAETGHLVFGTLHTTTAASTIDRIIDQFPADRQQQIRVMLSESLKGVIAQTLLPKKGGGRVAALEVLIVTPAISNLIREGKTFQIPSAMQTGKQQGMVMLNDALMELVQKGVVEPRDAYIKSVDKSGFEAQLARNGLKI